MKPDWAQKAAREICDIGRMTTRAHDSLPAELQRMQSEFMASIIRKHAARAGRQQLKAIGTVVKSILSSPILKSPDHGDHPIARSGGVQ